MTIQTDSREKARITARMTQEIEKQEIAYRSLDHPRLIIDRKQNLSELCSNVCQDHERFRAELIRAQENGIQLMILCEHGKGVECLEDIIWWNNPRGDKRVRDKRIGKWKMVKTNAVQGEKLYKILCTMEKKYGCIFRFGSREETGKKIIEILGENDD